jgi:hypothetical protein
VSGTPRVAIDNDIVLKASSYGLALNFWPADGPDIAVLAAARFVVPTYIDRGRGRDKARAKIQLATLLARASFLEPTELEIQMALSFESAAQTGRLALDTGESLLCAMVITRSMDSLETGDKRAIESLEKLLEHADDLVALCGRVRSLEQVVRASISYDPTFRVISAAICAEPDIDKALSICFSCWVSGATRNSAVAALDSYVNDLRTRAARILSAT